MRDLFARAAEAESAVDDPTRSLAEIQEIGAAAGLDPATIARVAERVDALPDEAAGLLGPPPTLVLRSTMSSLPVPPVEMIVDALRRAAGTLGETRQVGSGVEWRQVNDYSVVAASVSSDRNGVRVEIQGYYGLRRLLVMSIGVTGGAFGGFARCGV